MSRKTRPAASLAILACLLLVAAAACDDDYADPAISPSLTPIASLFATPTPSLNLGLTSATVTRVIDGDTIEVEISGVEYTVRYIGIDTPETVDPRRPVGCFGAEASARNRELVEGKAVELEKDVSETDDFGRLLRYVWADGQMVNETLVRDGYALAATYPPDVRYAELFASLQMAAREAGRGLWGPACEAGAATATPVASPGAGACEFSGTVEPVIKGNISVSSGEKIYHVPGGAYYDETVIDESRGERWFCTEVEAIAAGWRKSMV